MSSCIVTTNPSITGINPLIPLLVSVGSHNYRIVDTSEEVVCKDELFSNIEIHLADCAPCWVWVKYEALPLISQWLKHTNAYAWNTFDILTHYLQHFWSLLPHRIKIYIIKKLPNIRHNHKSPWIVGWMGGCLVKIATERRPSQHKSLRSS